MKKSTITKTWLSGMVAIALGLAVAGTAVALMLAYGGTFTTAPSGTGYDFVPRTDGFFAVLVAFIVAGGSAASVGAIVQLVAWIGALINSYQLTDKTWFVVTLILGLLGFGLIAMVVYLIAAPDGYAGKPAYTPQPSSLAPTS